MHLLPTLTRAGAVAALLAASAAPSHAGGRGAAFHPGGGFRGGFAGWRPPAGGRFWGGRGVPPVSGVIHERPGLRPTVSVYGHTGTSLRYGGGGSMFGRAGAPVGGAARPYAAGYGHVGTAVRPQVFAGGRPFYGRFGRGGLRPGEGRRFLAGRGFVGGLGGGLGYGFGDYGFGGYGAPGLYGAPGTYGDRGSYGSVGTYGGQGTYGSTATQSVYGNGGIVPYRSERPLAASYAEPPLGPSPDAPYSPDDRYAGDGAPRFATAARIIRVHRGGSWDACGCGRSPAVLPYGVGTAY